MDPQEADLSDPFVSEGAQSALDIWSFLSVARRFWWLIAAGLVAGAGGGLVVAKFTAPEYVSTAEIKVERRASSSAISMSGGPVTFEGATTTEDLKTIEKSFASPGLMRRVAGRLRQSGHADLPLGGKPIADLNDDAVTGYLLAGCGVTLIPETRLIQISFSSPDPEAAQSILDVIVREGIQNEMDQRVAASAANIRDIREEVQKFEDNLRASEEKLNTYTRTLGNVSIDNDLNIVATQLREINSRSTAAKADRLRLENEFAQVQSRAGSLEKLMEIESIQRLPSVMSLTSQISEARGKIEKLALRYRDSNPFMMQARSELAALEDALRKEVLQAPKVIEAQLASVRRAEEAILQEQQLQEEKVIQVRDLAVPSRVLQRQIDADRQAYEVALKRLTEELSNARSQPVLLQVVNPAGAALPSGTKPVRIIGIALFIGAMLGFGIVFLIAQLDTSVKSPEEAERFFRLPVLSAVPRYEAEFLEETDASAHSGFFERCPTLSDKYSATAEAFRAFRAALQARAEEESGQAILIAGSIEGDGVTFCAANLAAVLAQAGRRTLLVDANLRHPCLEKLVFGACGKTGLTEYLHGEAGLANILHASPVPLLDIVPAGRPCPFPAESLSRERFARFLNRSRPLYDQIIVDSPAIGKFSDTLGFARLFSFLCLVVGSAKTPKSIAKRSIDLLGHSGVRATGIVLNSTPAVFHKKARESAEIEAEEAAAAFSKALLECPACGKVFRTFPQFLASTSGPEKPPPGETADGRVFRRCSCGRILGVRMPEMRDTSHAGEERRRIFGELLGRLEAGGLPHEEARRQLLLNLKIWRNEIPDETARSPSRATSEREKLFEQLLDGLEASGIGKEDARELLNRAVDAWRSAP